MFSSPWCPLFVRCWGALGWQGAGAPRQSWLQLLANADPLNKSCGGLAAACYLPAAPASHHHPRTEHQERTLVRAPSCACWTTSLHACRRRRGPMDGAGHSRRKRTKQGGAPGGAGAVDIATAGSPRSAALPLPPFAGVYVDDIRKEDLAALFHMVRASARGQSALRTPALPQRGSAAMAAGAVWAAPQGARLGQWTAAAARRPCAANPFRTAGPGSLPGSLPRGSLSHAAISPRQPPRQPRSPSESH